jgi:dipeptidyl aminopeptidase/acylaminoacyl peptidase
MLSSLNNLRYRCILLTIAGLLVAYLLVNFSLAWIYTYRLTHPGCRQPIPISGLDPPQEVWLHGESNFQLRAWYYLPKNGAAIIAASGTEGALGQNLPPVYSLIEQGFGVLQLDSRACGRSTHPVTLGGLETQDILAGVDFLSRRPEVDRIGALGFSMGGAAVIRAAASDRRILAVVDEGGFYNLGDDIVEPSATMSIFSRFFLYNIAWSFWLQTGVDPWKISPVDDIANIAPRPVLLIYGEQESQSGRAELQGTTAREPKELWIVPGVGHGQVYRVVGEEYDARLLEFFSHYLLGSNETP